MSGVKSITTRSQSIGAYLTSEEKLLRKTIGDSAAGKRSDPQKGGAATIRKRERDLLKMVLFLCRWNPP